MKSSPLNIDAEELALQIEVRRDGDGVRLRREEWERLVGYVRHLERACGIEPVGSPWWPWEGR